MGKSKLGSPFKLKNQGVGGIIGAGISGALPSMLQVLKLKYPDVFETTQEKIEKQKLKLLQQKMKLDEEELAFRVAQEATELAKKKDLLRYELNLKDMYSDENLEEAERRKQREIEAEEKRPSIVAQKEVNIETAEDLRSKRKRAEELAPIEKETAEIQRDIKGQELEQIKIDTKVKKELDSLGLLLEKEKLPLAKLKLEQTQEFNNLYELQTKLTQQQFENQMDIELYNLKRLSEINDIEYKKGMLALKEGARGGMSSAEQGLMRAWLTISASSMQAFASADDPNLPIAQRALQVSIHATNNANEIMARNGLTSYQMYIPTGIDKKGRIEYMPPSPQGGLQNRPPQVSPQSYQPNFMSPSNELNFQLNGLDLLPDIETDEYGNPKMSIFKSIGPKKKVR